MITETPRQTTLTPLHSASHFKSKYIKFRYTQNKNCQNRIGSVTTQIRDYQQNQSFQILLVISTEEEIISLIIFKLISELLATVHQNSQQVKYSKEHQ